MHLTHLQLANFRNYRELHLELPPGVVLCWGDNAHGKTNLLESIALLATTRSQRAATEAELINWEAAGGEAPFARVYGHAQRAADHVEVEVVVAGRPASRARPPTFDQQWLEEAPPVPRGGLLASKRLRVNGLPRRAVDVVGQVAAVSFSTLDIEALTGSPSARRRLLDLLIGQLDRAYVRALQRYGKVLVQRNALLRRIQEGKAPEELEFWDAELTTAGGYLIAARARWLRQLHSRAAEAHGRLSQGTEQLLLRYHPQLPAAVGPPPRDPDTNEARELLARALTLGRARDVAAGMTLSGPHRDDLLVAIDGAPLASYGSRAQQRSAALALRLAEAPLLASARGETPILLLDDVLSELDEGRQRAVLEAVCAAPQALVTATELSRFPAALRREAAVYRVQDGTLSRTASS